MKVMKAIRSTPVVLSFTDAAAGNVHSAEYASIYEWLDTHYPSRWCFLDARTEVAFGVVEQTVLPGALNVIVLENLKEIDISVDLQTVASIR